MSDEGGITNAAFSVYNNEIEEQSCKVREKFTSPAIEIQNVSLTYGKGENATHALRNVSLTIPESIIFALLGPSGCGKTSLLCSLFGTKNNRQGEIKIFGAPPNSSKCGVPGPWVGYMPQELSLYMELTVEETLRYFARLQQIGEPVLCERISSLINLVELTDTKNQLVKSLSGGQQRRLSLAVSIVHYPALLILDEPTVGVDPLLRTTIWKHLVELCHQQGITIIITTHYIEEAKRADMVGLMRDGRLLRVGNPQDLMLRMNSKTLERVFYKLCVDDAKDANGQENDLQTDCSEVNTVDHQNPNHSTNESKHLKTKRILIYRRSVNRNWVHFLCMVAAVTSKNTALLRRNPVFLVAAFFTPVANLFMVKLMYGHTPYGIPIAVANVDRFPVVSNLFLERIDNRTLYYASYPDREAAIQSVRDGYTKAALYFPQNYSVNMAQRNRLGFQTDNVSLWGSVSYLYLDKSSVEISRTIFISLLDSITQLVKTNIRYTGLNPLAADSPLVFKDPLYGSMKTEFTDFTIANFLPDIMFLMAMCLSALTLIAEQNNGLFCRCQVSGLTVTHVLISHMILQNIIFFFQVCGLIAFLYAFKIESVGNLGLVGFLCFIQGNVGMAVGVLISAITSISFIALSVATGCYETNLLTSGCLWPIESFPYWMRPISYCGPETFTILAVREIINRGLSWTSRWVWTSLLISCAWTMLPLLLAILIFRRSL